MIVNGRRTISGFVAVLVAVVGFLAAPRDALACRPVATYTINENEIIAEGWVENVEITESSTRESFLPVRVTLRVLRSWKGQAPARIVFVDEASYLVNSAAIGGGMWDGSGGACGALNEDPTGKYGLVVFKWMDGQLVTSGYRGAKFGVGPEDPKIEQFRRYIQDNVHIVEQPRVLPDPQDSAVGLEDGWQALAGMVLLTAVGGVAVGGVITLTGQRNRRR